MRDAALLEAWARKVGSATAAQNPISDLHGLAKEFACLPKSQQRMVVQSGCGKSMGRWVRVSLQPGAAAGGKGAKIGAQKLAEVEAGLRLVSSFAGSAPGSFAPMEVERLCYHLIASAVDISNTPLAVAGLMALQKLLLAISPDDDKDGNVLATSDESLVGFGWSSSSGTAATSVANDAPQDPFPPPPVECNSDLARLVSGGLLNNIQAMAAEASAAALTVASGSNNGNAKYSGCPPVRRMVPWLGKACVAWFGQMLTLGDSKGVDYVARAWKVMSLIATKQLALLQYHTQQRHHQRPQQGQRQVDEESLATATVAQLTEGALLALYESMRLRRALVPSPSSSGTADLLLEANSIAARCLKMLDGVGGDKREGNRYFPAMQIVRQFCEHVACDLIKDDCSGGGGGGGGIGGVAPAAAYSRLVLQASTLCVCLGDMEANARLLTRCADLVLISDDGCYPPANNAVTAAAEDQQRGKSKTSEGSRNAERRTNKGGLNHSVSGGGCNLDDIAARRFMRSLFAFTQCISKFQHGKQHSFLSPSSSSSSRGGHVMPWRSSDATLLGRSIKELRHAFRAASTVALSSSSWSAVPLSAECSSVLVATWRAMTKLPSLLSFGDSAKLLERPLETPYAIASTCTSSISFLSCRRTALQQQPNQTSEGRKAQKCILSNDKSNSNSGRGGADAWGELFEDALNACAITASSLLHLYTTQRLSVSRVSSGAEVRGGSETSMEIREKLKPHLRNNVVESMTRVASLRCLVLSHTITHTAASSGRAACNLSDAAAAETVAACDRGLCAATGHLSSAAQVQHVALAHFHLGITVAEIFAARQRVQEVSGDEEQVEKPSLPLSAPCIGEISLAKSSSRNAPSSFSSSYPLLLRHGLLPMLRACALLEGHVKATAKTAEARATLLDNCKLSQRYTTLANALLQCATSTIATYTKGGSGGDGARGIGSSVEAGVNAVRAIACRVLRKAFAESVGIARGAVPSGEMLERLLNTQISAEMSSLRFVHNDREGKLSFSSPLRSLPALGQHLPSAFMDELCRLPFFAANVDHLDDLSRGGDFLHYDAFSHDDNDADDNDGDCQLRPRLRQQQQQQQQLLLHFPPIVCLTPLLSATMVAVPSDLPTATALREMNALVAALDRVTAVTGGDGGGYRYLRRILASHDTLLRRCFLAATVTDDNIGAPGDGDEIALKMQFCDVSVCAALVQSAVSYQRASHVCLPCDYLGRISRDVTNGDTTSTAAVVSRNETEMLGAFKTELEDDGSEIEHVSCTNVSILAEENSRYFRARERAQTTTTTAKIPQYVHRGINGVWSDARNEAPVVVLGRILLLRARCLSRRAVAVLNRVLSVLSSEEKVGCIVGDGGVAFRKVVSVELGVAHLRLGLLIRELDEYFPDIDDTNEDDNDFENKFGGGCSGDKEGDDDSMYSLVQRKERWAASRHFDAALDACATAIECFKAAGQSGKKGEVSQDCRCRRVVSLSSSVLSSSPLTSSSSLVRIGVLWPERQRRYRGELMGCLSLLGDHYSGQQLTWKHVRTFALRVRLIAIATLEATTDAAANAASAIKESERSVDGSVGNGDSLSSSISLPFSDVDVVGVAQEAAIVAWHVAGVAFAGVADKSETGLSVALRAVLRLPRKVLDALSQSTDDDLMVGGRRAARALSMPSSSSSLWEYSSLSLPSRASLLYSWLDAGGLLLTDFDTWPYVAAEDRIHQQTRLAPLRLEHDDDMGGSIGGGSGRSVLAEEQQQRFEVSCLLASADLNRLRGDVARETAHLRDAAAKLGGRAGGKFAQVGFPSRSFWSPRTARPVSEGSWWWLHSYAFVLLRIGDSWVARCKPAKALQYFECALQLCRSGGCSGGSALYKTALLRQLDLALRRGRRLHDSNGDPWNRSHGSTGNSSAEYILNVTKGSIDGLFSPSSWPSSSLSVKEDDGLTYARVCFLLARGDVYRRQRSLANDTNKKDSLRLAGECYGAAEVLLGRLREKEFMDPLLEVAGASSTSAASASPPPPGSSNRSSGDRGCGFGGWGSGSGGNLKSPEQNLLGAVYWRVARVLWLEGRYVAAVAKFEAVLALVEPSNSLAQAIANYRLARASLSGRAVHVKLPQRQVSRGNEDDDEKMEVNEDKIDGEDGSKGREIAALLVARAHLRRSLAEAQCHTNAKLHRNVLRSLALTDYTIDMICRAKTAAAAAAATTVATATTDHGAVAPWLACRSIGVAQATTAYDFAPPCQKPFSPLPPLSLPKSGSSSEKNSASSSSSLKGITPLPPAPSKAKQTNQPWNEASEVLAVSDVEATVELLRSSVNRLPPHWVLASLCLSPQGHLILSRLQSNQPSVVAVIPDPLAEDALADLQHDYHRPSSSSPLGQSSKRGAGGGGGGVDGLREILGSFEMFLADNRRSLQVSDPSKAAKMGREEKVEWWATRQALDTRLVALLRKLSRYVGGFKALLCGDFADGSRMASVESAVQSILGHTSTPAAAAAAAASSTATAAGTATASQVHTVVNAGLLRATVLAARDLEPAELRQALAAALEQESAAGSSSSITVIDSAVGIIQSHGLLGCGSGGGSTTNTAALSPKQQPPAAPSMALLVKLKVAELKRRLAELGQPTTGLKKQLVERLFDTLCGATPPPSVPPPETDATTDTDSSVNTASSVVPSSLSSSSSPSSSSFRRHPVILILDERLQRLPWEGTDFLRSHPVSRAPSLAYVLARALPYRPSFSCIAETPSTAGKMSGKKFVKRAAVAMSTVGSTDENSATDDGSGDVVSQGVRASSGYLIVDPEGNLPRTRVALAPLVATLRGRGNAADCAKKKHRGVGKSAEAMGGGGYGQRHSMGWSGVVGSAPSEEELCTALRRRDVLLYCGHGAGERIIRRSTVEGLTPPPLSSAASSSTSSSSPFVDKKSLNFTTTPTNNSSSSTGKGIGCVALLMGCSSGQLQLNGDFEPHGMAAAYLDAGCPSLVGNLWDVTDKEIDRLTVTLVDTWLVDNNRNRSLLQSIADARGACKFASLTGAAVVCYGVPVYTAADSR
jgi:hypothetical protein